MSYWNGKAKSENSFDINIRDLIWKYSYKNPYKKDNVIATQVGQLAYGIWKALNARNTKIANNLADVETNGCAYTVDQKIDNINLIVVDSKTESSAYGYNTSETKILICEDEATGWKYKLRLGKNVSKKLAELVSELKFENKLVEWKKDPELNKIFNINISGKVAKISNEYKTITLNYVTINSPTDEEVETATNVFKQQLNDAMAKIKMSEALASKLNTFKILYDALEKDPTLNISEEVKNYFKAEIDKITPEEYDMLSVDEKRLIGKIENKFY